jgi:uncharacterized LabA/DUF88 family protein
MKCAVFIDYDNLEDHHKKKGIVQIVTMAMSQALPNTVSDRGICDTRIYGGWYEQNSLTRLAQDLSVEIQNEFPKIIRILNGNSSAGVTMFATNVCLAVSLLEEPDNIIFNSYRRKGKPSNVRVEKPSTVNCLNGDCPLENTRKILKKGICPIESCTSTTSLVYRHEQKTVDTMLSCDLIYSCGLSYDLHVLISSDDDFLPPIRSALLKGTSVVRLHPKLGYKKITFPTGGAPLIEKDF